MRRTTTILLLLLVLGLGIFVATYEHKLPGTKERIVLKTRPYAFDAAEVDTIEIITKEKPLKLEKKNDVWVVEKPYTDRANPDLIKKLVEGVASLEWLETLSRKDLKSEDYRRTGLGSTSMIEVILQKNKHKVAHFNIGAKAAIEESVYVNLPTEESKVYLAKTTLPELLQTAPEEWRDPKLARINVDTIQRFSLSSGNGAIEFNREGGKQWQIVKPLQTRASDERVNAVLAAILNLEIKTEKKREAPAVAASTALPTMKITMDVFGSDKPLLITLHPAADPTASIIAEISNREGSFQVPAKAESFWKLQPNHLRDQNLAHIVKEDVTALRIRSARFSEVVMDRKGQDWTLARYGKDEPANEERIQQLFDKLNIEQIREFVSDAATNVDVYGLTKPFLEVAWTTPAKTMTLQFGTGAEGTVFARYVDEPFIYRINPQIFASIPPDATKWQSLKVIGENMFAARRVVISEGDSPALTLLYNPEDATWTGTLASNDITPRLDRAKANQLLQKLLNFEVSDWSSDRSAAYEALKHPTLIVQLLFSDPEDPNAPPKATTMSFAPLTAGMDTAIYHGKLEDKPDTFLISRDIYQELIKSPLTAK